MGRVIVLWQLAMPGFVDTRRRPILLWIEMEEEWIRGGIRRSMDRVGGEDKGGGSG